MDRGAWWATVHRVAKNQTWLKQLSTHIHGLWTHGRQSFESKQVQSLIYSIELYKIADIWVCLTYKILHTKNAPIAITAAIFIPCFIHALLIPDQIKIHLLPTELLPFHFPLSCIGEGNGDSLQCSCLENPRDRGPWWAAIYRVTQSRTWQKRVSSSSSRASMYL